MSYFVIDHKGFKVEVDIRSTDVKATIYHNGTEIDTVYCGVNYGGGYDLDKILREVDRSLSRVH